MTRGQRRIVLIAIPAMAWLLHVTHVDWHFRKERTGGDYIVLRWREQPFGRTYGGEIARYTGIHPQANVDRSSAVVYGVTVPLVLLTLEVWLWLGWRRKDRIARGFCGNCGHDLRGADHDKCPECGTPT